MNVERLLAERAERGEARGPEQVWAAAVGTPRRRRRWPAVLAAAAVAAAVIGGVEALRGPEGEPSPARVAPTATPTPTPEPAAKPPLVGLAGPELDAAYLACARERGFDPQAAQVILHRGRPYSVKTGHEVPAEVHRPCLVALGGRDPLGSSYGYPDALGECEGVDRDPPIDWSPAPPAGDTGSVVEPVRAAVRPGEPVELTWSAALTAVPADVSVECWNGQEWTVAYHALGLTGEPRAVEVRQGTPSEEEVPPGSATARVAVPDVAPRSTYRVVTTATLCDADGCREVPFEVRFAVP